MVHLVYVAKAKSRRRLLAKQEAADQVPSAPTMGAVEVLVADLHSHARRMDCLRLRIRPYATRCCQPKLALDQSLQHSAAKVGEK